MQLHLRNFSNLQHTSKGCASQKQKLSILGAQMQTQIRNYQFWVCTSSVGVPATLNILSNWSKTSLTPGKHGQPFIISTKMQPAPHISRLGEIVKPCTNLIIEMKLPIRDPNYTKEELKCVFCFFYLVVQFVEPKRTSGGRYLWQRAILFYSIQLSTS